MDDQSENHSNPTPQKNPQRDCPKQLKTHNVPTDDVENANGTN